MIPVIAIHAGAGRLVRSAIDPQRDAAVRERLAAALLAGMQRLEAGGCALHAIEAAVRVMEDSELFNAGRGAVFTHEGINELDACVMDGATERIGALAGLRCAKNPVSAAVRLLERNTYIFLSGDGADRFVRDSGLETVDPAYYYTARRWAELQRALAADSTGLSENTASGADRKLGTVGAVALDCLGHLAAATSTGGMTNKPLGRIGDSPVAGAGTWAKDGQCAVSCTGQGEFFIRAHAAADVAARMAYAGQSLREASSAAIAHVGELGGRGGLVCLDGAGNVFFPMNTEGMNRGWLRSGGRPRVAVYSDEVI